MRPLTTIIHAAILFATAHLLGTTCVAQVMPTRLNNGKTAVDEYVAAADETYDWKLVTNQSANGMTMYVVDMKSQTWLGQDEVDRPVWQHWLTIIKPDKTTASTALMFIDGGSNGRQPPNGPDPRLVHLAKATGSVVANIGMIPNQPLVFHGDGKPRKEDDLIGYTWDQYLKTGDVRWPARMPMVKSVVRGMDTVQSLLKEQAPDGPNVDSFVVAGASKRGWTTWMTAAVDKRVKAIAPIVIDVLNANVSMAHHYAAYGFWAPAINDYVHHRIVHRRFTPRYQDLLQLVDPFAYRNRLTMPKCIINATGDQFFLPDSSQFYFDELPGEKHLCYVPNAEHSLRGTNALDSLVAFHYAIVNDIPRPEFSWSYPNPASIEVVCENEPSKVLLWQATNAETRDFRVDTIGRAYESTPVTKDKSGVFKASVQAPEKGWTAFLMQMEFDIGAPVPIRLTTPVQVIPDALPFADKQAPVDK